MEPIVDSNMTFEEATAGTKAPQDVIDQLELVDVAYLSFDDKVHRGQIVVHKDLVSDLESFFKEALRARFPIEKVIPVVSYGWDDHSSIYDNNTSAFNYRFVSGTDRVSNHSYGRAIDMNPKLNPFITSEGVSRPEGCFYNINVKGTIQNNGFVVEFFRTRGWKWGGDWKESKGYVDYQHFQKLD